MLKKADDKSKRLALLEDLQKSQLLDSRQKKWCRQELVRVRKGIKGERDSAYYLDQYFKGGENHIVLHDLRLQFEGDVAQIDHLVINRLGFIFLIETKNYSGNVTINSQGEFVVDYDGEELRVPSPIEQSHRHERILRRLMERLEIANRVGGALECHHVVMFNEKSIIKRPPASEFDTSNVIKADQFPTWHSRFADGVGIGFLMRGLANARSLETINEWGEKLIRQHRADNQLALPEFMQAKLRPAAPSVAGSAPILPTVVKPTVSADAAEPGAKRLICLHCGDKISYREGQFCWNHVDRFKGGQYCREHQALFPA